MPRVRKSVCNTPNGGDFVSGPERETLSQPRCWEGRSSATSVRRRGGGTGELARHEMGVQAAPRQEFQVRADFHHSPLVQHDNRIGVAYG